MPYGFGVYYWTEEVAPQRGRHGVRFRVTSRRGGVSAPPFQGLNLGGGTGDVSTAVESNRAAVARSLGVSRERLVFMDQRHGTQVRVVDGSSRAHPRPADGLVTTRDDVALAVLVADCVPVLLADPVAGVVGAVHVGRSGLVGRIVDRAVETMAGLGAVTIRAVVGPSVCGRCYEVPPGLRDDAARVSPLSATLSWTGTAAIDIAAGVVEQLTGHHVAVTWVPGCSREDPELYSYRRSATTGRFAGVVRLVPPGAT